MKIRVRPAALPPSIALGFVTWLSARLALSVLAAIGIGGIGLLLIGCGGASEHPDREELPAALAQAAERLEERGHQVEPIGIGPDKRVPGLVVETEDEPTVLVLREGEWAIGATARRSGGETVDTSVSVSCPTATAAGAPPGPSKAVLRELCPARRLPRDG